MTTCPHCNGEGQNHGIACGPTGGRIGFFKCSTCYGAGQISEEHIERITRGAAMREDRVERRRITQGEEAKRLKVDVAEWSRIERGKKPETEAGQRAFDIRLQEMNGKNATEKTCSNDYGYCDTHGFH